MKNKISPLAIGLLITLVFLTTIGSVSAYREVVVTREVIPHISGFSVLAQYDVPENIGTISEPENSDVGIIIEELETEFIGESLLNQESAETEEVELALSEKESGQPGTISFLFWI